MSVMFIRRTAAHTVKTLHQAQRSWLLAWKFVNVLSNIIGVKAPVIIDNGERVSEGNMPELDTQMIILSVSDDKDFRIEVR